MCPDSDPRSISVKSQRHGTACGVVKSFVTDASSKQIRSPRSGKNVERDVSSLDTRRHKMDNSSGDAAEEEEEDNFDLTSCNTQHRSIVTGSLCSDLLVSPSSKIDGDEGLKRSLCLTVTGKHGFSPLRRASWVPGSQVGIAGLDLSPSIVGGSNYRKGFTPTSRIEKKFITGWDYLTSKPKATGTGLGVSDTRDIVGRRCRRNSAQPSIGESSVTEEERGVRWTESSNNMRATYTARAAQKGEEMDSDEISDRERSRDLQEESSLLRLRENKYSGKRHLPVSDGVTVTDRRSLMGGRVPGPVATAAAEEASSHLPNNNNNSNVEEDAKSMLSGLSRKTTEGQLTRLDTQGKSASMRQKLPVRTRKQTLSHLSYHYDDLNDFDDLLGAETDFFEFNSNKEPDSMAFDEVRSNKSELEDEGQNNASNRRSYTARTSLKSNELKEDSRLARSESTQIKSNGTLEACRLRSIRNCPKRSGSRTARRLSTVCTDDISAELSKQDEHLLFASDLLNDELCKEASTQNVRRRFYSKTPSSKDLGDHDGSITSDYDQLGTLMFKGTDVSANQRLPFRTPYKKGHENPYLNHGGIVAPTSKINGSSTLSTAPTTAGSHRTVSQFERMSQDAKLSSSNNSNTGLSRLSGFCSKSGGQDQSFDFNDILSDLISKDVSVDLAWTKQLASLKQIRYLCSDKDEAKGLLISKVPLTGKSRALLHTLSLNVATTRANGPSGALASLMIGSVFLAYTIPLCDSLRSQLVKAALQTIHDLIIYSEGMICEVGGSVMEDLFFTLFRKTSAAHSGNAFLGEEALKTLKAVAIVNSIQRNSSVLAKLLRDNRGTKSKGRIFWTMALTALRSDPENLDKSLTNNREFQHLLQAAAGSLNDSNNEIKNYARFFVYILRGLMPSFDSKALGILPNSCLTNIRQAVAQIKGKDLASLHTLIQALEDTYDAKSLPYMAEITSVVLQNVHTVMESSGGSIRYDCGNLGQYGVYSDSGSNLTPSSPSTGLDRILAPSRGPKGFGPECTRAVSRGQFSVNRETSGDLLNRIESFTDSKRSASVLNSAYAQSNPKRVPARKEGQGPRSRNGAGLSQGFNEDVRPLRGPMPFLNGGRMTSLSQTKSITIAPGPEVEHHNLAMGDSPMTGVKPSGCKQRLGKKPSAGAAGNERKLNIAPTAGSGFRQSAG